MKTIKNFIFLVVFQLGIISIAVSQTYSTDFDGVGNGSSITISPGSSSGSIVAPSLSTIVNYNKITPAAKTYTVPAPSAPSVSTMVGGMIMQSMINSLFTPVDNSKADAAAAAAAAQAKLIEDQKKAAELAKLKKYNDSVALVKYNKLLKNKLDIPGSNTDLQPMGLPMNNPPSTANSIDYIDGESIESIRSGMPSNSTNVVDLSHVEGNGTVGSLKEMQSEIEETYNVKLQSEVPPLPEGLPEIKSNSTEVAIEKTRGVLVEVAGMLPPGLNYATITAVNVLAADAFLINGCFYMNPPNCPSTGKILGKITENVIIDVGSAAVGDLGSKYFGKITEGWKATGKLSSTTAKDVLIGSIDDVKDTYKDWNLNTNLLQKNLFLNEKKGASDVFSTFAGSISGKGLELIDAVYDKEKPYNPWDW